MCWIFYSRSVYIARGKKWVGGEVGPRKVRFSSFLRTISSQRPDWVCWVSEKSKKYHTRDTIFTTPILSLCCTSPLNFLFVSHSQEKGEDHERKGLRPTQVQENAKGKFKRRVDSLCDSVNPHRLFYQSVWRGIKSKGDVCKVSRACPRQAVPYVNTCYIRYLYHTVRMMILVLDSQEVSKSPSNHVCYCAIQCNGTVKKQWFLVLVAFILLITCCLSPSLILDAPSNLMHTDYSTLVALFLVCSNSWYWLL